MKRSIFWTIGGALSLLAIIAINVSLAKPNKISDKWTLTQIEVAVGESFEFNGQNWNDEDHWWQFGDWNPVLIDCTGYDRNSQGYVISSWPGQKVQCQHGNGNCVDGTSCIGNPAS